MITGGRRLILTLLILTGFAAGLLLGWERADHVAWVGTWAASPEGAAADAPILENQTLREIVHTSAGGKHVRVRLSNQAGTQSVVIGAARLALHASGSSHTTKSTSMVGRGCETIETAKPPMTV